MSQAVKSMTGFAAVTGDLAHGRVALELKSVNHRYLEFQTRMPEEFRGLEGAMREQLAAALSRGKVDCRVTFTADPSKTSGEINDTALTQLENLQAQVQRRFPQAALLSVADILRSPGVMATNEVSTDQVRDAMLGVFARAVAELDATRVREGAKLAQMIIERLDAIEQLVAKVAPIVPQMVAAYEEKLRQKLVEAGATSSNAGSPSGSVDDRLKQEAVLFASRIDIAEELNRLSAHVSEVRRVLKQGGSVGKRLDFLMQELNREANTLGSKSVSTESTNVSIELKVLIEQMREQSQNIE
jgi:uncharacterized protein (TIGR00255 family)